MCRYVDTRYNSVRPTRSGISVSIMRENSCSKWVICSCFVGNFIRRFGRWGEKTIPVREYRNVLMVFILLGDNVGRMNAFTCIEEDCI